MARIFGMGNQGGMGILGAQQTQPWQGTLGILASALKDATNSFSGNGGDTDNLSKWNATQGQNQQRQQLIAGLTSEDPAIRQQAYGIAPLFGIDPSAFQKQRAAQALPQLLTSMKPHQENVAALQLDNGASTPAFDYQAPGMNISDALAASGSPELTAQYAPDLIKQQIEMAAKAKRTLTPQEAAAAGFKPGSVVQVDPNNDYSVAQASDVASNDKLAQELWLKNNDPALAISRANLGLSQQRLALDRMKADRGEIPTGYRAGPNGTLAFIPGGPADPSKGAGKKAPTEDQAKNNQLYMRASQQLPIVLNNFDALASWQNQVPRGLVGAVNGLPLVNIDPGLVTGSQGRQAENALKDIAASYLYSVSGATANPGEVKNLADTIMPRAIDSADVLSQKKVRLQQMVDSIKLRAQPGADAQLTPSNLPRTSSPPPANQGWGNFRVHP